MTKSLKIKAKYFDKGLNRLYCTDTQDRRLVLIDNGRAYAKGWGLLRFSLCTHSKDGEPEAVLKSKWVLEISDELLSDIFKS